MVAETHFLTLGSHEHLPMNKTRSRTELTLLADQPLPLQIWSFEVGSSTVTVRAGCEREHGRRPSGHQGLHARGTQTGHTLTFMESQFASGVLHALPFLEQEQEIHIV